MGRCNMVCISWRGSSYYFCINGGAPGLGVLIFFQDQCSAAFTKYKTVAIFIEWSWSSSRVIISFRQGFHCIKSSNSGWNDSRLRSSRHHDISPPKFDFIYRTQNRVIWRRTSRYSTVISTSKAIFNGNISCSYIRDHPGYQEWVKPGCTITSGKFNNLIFKRL